MIQKDNLYSEGTVRNFWLHVIAKPSIYCRHQHFSMRGFGGGLGAEPPAAGGHWGSGGEAQLPE